MFKPNATFLHCSLYSQLPLSNASACWSIGRYRRSKHRKLLTSFSMTHQLLHVNFWLLRPMSHLRFYSAICRTSARLYRATKSQTLRLSSCTLRLCRINKHGFCTTFPVSRSSFTNTVPKWWNRSISNLFWTLRLIARFHCARQPSKTELLARIS